MRRKIPDLTTLGCQLEQVDLMILTLMKQRMGLALRVEESKRLQDPDHPGPIIRTEIEDGRLASLAARAGELGLNENLVRSIFYQLISESCRVQVVQLQDHSRHYPVSVSDDVYLSHLRDNLIRLTELVAPTYDEKYRSRYPAMKQYLAYEREFMAQEIAGMAIPRTCALDLGCGTGAFVREIAGSFDSVIGYDLSPAMVSVAREWCVDTPNATFEARDVEMGLPLDSSSVAFVTMSLGTASDIPNLTGVLGEIERVLIPGGRFLLSFYNADALVYAWEFLPWPLPLAARVGVNEHSLQVRVGQEVFEIFARAYRMAQLKGMMPDGLRIDESRTYPTLGSLLPGEAFREEGALKQVAHADHELSALDMGAYILLSGGKRKW